MIWLPTTSQGFQVKTSYKALRWGATNIHLESNWNVKVPSRVAFIFLVWTANG